MELTLVVHKLSLVKWWPRCNESAKSSSLHNEDTAMNISQCD